MKKQIALCAVVFVACLYLGAYVSHVHSDAWYCDPALFLCGVGAGGSIVTAVVRLVLSEEWI